MLAPHDPEWNRLFEEEKQLLLMTFGDRIKAIEHIGSTSIPGIPAKPIIDILAAVESLEDIDVFIKTLPELGYTFMLCLSADSLTGTFFLKVLNLLELII